MLYRYDLHVLMVEHGKRCPRCAKNGKPRKESHGPCPLTNLAAAASKDNPLSAEAAAGDAKHALETGAKSPQSRSCCSWHGSKGVGRAFLRRKC